MRWLLPAFLFLGTLTACHSLVVVNRPDVYIETANPERVWVTETNDSLLALDSPAINGDTLSGYVRGMRTELTAEDVQTVRVRKFDWLRTAALYSGVVLSTALVFRYAIESDQEGSGCGPCPSGCQRPPQCDGIP